MRDSYEINRTKILEAARKIVAERGVHNTSLRDIAKEAQMSNGALYYYFNSKDLILYALMDHPNTMPKKLAEKVKSSSLNQEQIIDRIMAVFEGRIADIPTTKLFIYLAQEAIVGNEELKKKFVEQYEEWVLSLEDVIVTLLGVPKSSTTRGLAILLEAVNEGILIRNLLGCDYGDAIGLMREILSGNFNEIFEEIAANKKGNISDTPSPGV